MFAHKTQLHNIFWQAWVCQPLLSSPELLRLHQIVHKSSVLSIQARAVGSLRLADLLLAGNKRKQSPVVSHMRKRVYVS
jgi:hypothetical protein